MLSLEGVADTKNPSVPIFGVPTTVGTASETTINYVITDTANKRKFVAVDPHDIPIVAFVDPDLTDSMPRGSRWHRTRRPDPRHRRYITPARGACPTACPCRPSA